VKIAMVTGSAASMKKALLADTASPKSYDIPKDDEVLEEDKIIAAWPLKIAADGVTIVSGDGIFGGGE
jgi:hypothetical protein